MTVKELIIMLAGMNPTDLIAIGLGDSLGNDVRYSTAIIDVHSAVVEVDGENYDVVVIDATL